MQDKREPGGHGRPGPGGPGGPGGGMADSALADALGISTEKLAAAVETARLAGVQQGLDRGFITQEQADALRNPHWRNGPGGPGGHGGPGGPGEPGGHGGAGGHGGPGGPSGRGGGQGVSMSLLRGAGIDPEALLAEALGISITAFKEARMKAMASRLAQDVKEGRLSQEQADTLLADARSGKRGPRPGPGG